jgi:hypothetical protein
LRGLPREGFTKFEVNQTNLKRVILPTSSSVSSGDLRPSRGHLTKLTNEGKNDVFTHMVHGIYGKTENPGYRTDDHFRLEL